MVALSQQVRVPGFDPESAGFAFPNSFPPSPVRVFDLPGGLGSISVGEAGDLAGGMCFTVGDLFFAGLQPPRDPAPTPGSPRYDYLVQRQLDSFGDGRVPVRFYQLMSGRSDDDERVVRDEWPKVKANVDGGRLCMLGLVKVHSRDPKDIAANHQVLAFGYDLSGSSVRIAVYDPNLPGREVGLVFSLEDGDGSGSGLSYEGEDGPVYAFFELPYLPRDPGPWREAEPEMAASSAAGGSAEPRKETAPKRAARRRTPPPVVATNIANDEATADDLLGYKDLAAALEQLIVDERTSYPLTIAVSAPWGAGKSSLMLQVRKRLTDREERAKRQRKATDQPSAKEKHWTIVMFNAWRYEAGEQLWAALAKGMYDAGSRGSWWHRFVFRTRLELKRMPLVRTIARLLVSLVSAAITAVVGYLVVQGTDPDSTKGPLGPTLAVIAPVLAFLGSAKIQWGDLIDPFKHAIDAYAGAPDDGDGFTKDASTNVAALLDLLLEDGNGIAIFVDDLDRCGPRNLVRMVEAVSQVFASTEVDDRAAPSDRKPRKLVFILGMDRRMVGRSIEVEYKDLIQRLHETDDQAAMSFGADFLDKIVQLWVTLPPAKDDGLEAVLRRAAGLALNRETGPTPTQVNLAVKDVQALAQGEGGPDAMARIADSTARLIQNEPDPGRRAALATANQQLLGRVLHDPEAVMPIFMAGLRHLERNPRQVTRYHNALRLQLYLATTTPGISFRREQLDAMARWVAIRMRWPTLAETMDTDLDLLAALEAAVNPTLKLPGPSITKEDPEKRLRWLDPTRFSESAALAEALTITRKAQSISGLPFEGFLRVS